MICWHTTRHDADAQKQSAQAQGVRPQGRAEALGACCAASICTGLGLPRVCYRFSVSVYRRFSQPYATSIAFAVPSGVARIARSSCVMVRIWLLDMIVV